MGSSVTRFDRSLLQQLYCSSPLAGRPGRQTANVSASGSRLPWRSGALRPGHQPRPHPRPDGSPRHRCQPRNLRPGQMRRHWPKPHNGQQCPVVPAKIPCRQSPKERGRRGQFPGLLTHSPGPLAGGNNTFALYIVFGPKTADLSELALAADRRWTIAQCFQGAKDDPGLDHGEARSWHGGHRPRGMVTAPPPSWPNAPPTCVAP